MKIGLEQYRIFLEYPFLFSILNFLRQFWDLLIKTYKEKY